MKKKELTFRRPILVVTGNENDILEAPNFSAQKVSLSEFGKLAVNKVKKSFVIFDFCSCVDENQRNKMQKQYKLIASHLDFMEQKNYTFLGQRGDFQKIKVPPQGIRLFGQQLVKAICWAN